MPEITSTRRRMHPGGFFTRASVVHQVNVYGQLSDYLTSARVLIELESPTSRALSSPADHCRHTLSAHAGQYCVCHDPGD
jgi:hypothetical protein